MKSGGCDRFGPIIRHLASVCICFQLIYDNEEERSFFFYNGIE